MHKIYNNPLKEFLSVFAYFAINNRLDIMKWASNIGHFTQRYLNGWGKSLIRLLPIKFPAYSVSLLGLVELASVSLD